MIVLTELRPAHVSNKDKYATRRGLLSFDREVVTNQLVQVWCRCGWVSRPYIAVGQAEAASHTHMNVCCEPREVVDVTPVVDAASNTLLCRPDGVMVPLKRRSQRFDPDEMPEPLENEGGADDEEAMRTKGRA